MGDAAKKRAPRLEPKADAGRRVFDPCAGREDIRVELSSNPKLLRSVRALVRAYLMSQDVDAERVTEIVLGVDEACSNAIRHSYGGRTNGRIELTMHCTDEAIVFQLCDEGSPVLQERCKRRELSSVDEIARDGGGIGVQLMHRIFDSVSYSSGEEEGNCVTLRLDRASTRARHGSHGT